METRVVCRRGRYSDGLMYSFRFEATLSIGQSYRWQCRCLGYLGDSITLPGELAGSCADLDFSAEKKIAWNSPFRP